MQRSATYKTYPLTIEDLKLIDRFTNDTCQLIDAARRNRIYDKKTRNLIYDIKSLATDLKYCLMHPDDMTTNELCTLLPAMKSADRISLLNQRPTLVKDVDDLYHLLKSIPKPEERLLLACSQIERLSHSNTEQIGKNIILIAKTLPRTHQTKFCKFAIRTLHEQLSKQHHQHTDAAVHKDKMEESFTASFLFSILTCTSYATNSSPAVTVLAFLSAIATAARGFKHFYQEQKLGAEISSTFSIWKKAIDRSNLNQNSTNPRPVLRSGL